MELSDPGEMAKLADDVRKQEEPFVGAAVASFESLFRSEYRRLRAAALEAGGYEATLNVTVRCRFEPGSRAIDMTSAPAPITYQSRRKAVAVGKSG